MPYPWTKLPGWKPGPRSSLLLRKPPRRTWNVLWASGGLRANRISPWHSPKPTLHIWSDASMHAGGAHTDSGLHFQRTWSELGAGKHINWLELRAAQYTLLQLACPGDVLQLHLDNTTAIAYIRKMGGTYSPFLYQESHLLWCQAIRRNLTLLSPLWISK